MNPILLGAVAVGGVLALAIGLGFHLLDRRSVEAILIGALQRANIALHRADALEEELAVTRLNLADADEALQEYREAVPKAFDLGMEAGLYLAEHQLATAEVEGAQREKARWN